MPRLLNWVLGGSAKDITTWGKAIVTGTPEAVGTLGKIVRGTGHAVGNIAAVPLIPIRLATKLVAAVPKTSAVIGLGAAGATAYSALNSHHASADFTNELQTDDAALREITAVQQPMQMQAMQQMAAAPMPTYQAPTPMTAQATGPGAAINYLDDPSRSIMASTAELQGPLMAQQQGVAQGAIR